MESYFLIGSAENLITLSKVANEIEGKKNFIASTAAGIIACKESRIDYTTIETYTANRDIINLGWKNYYNLNIFCDYFDELAIKESSTLESSGIKPFRFHYYFLKILIDSISIKILLLENLIERCKGFNLYVCEEKEESLISGNYLNIHNDVDMYSYLLKNLFYKNNSNIVIKECIGGNKKINYLERLRKYAITSKNFIINISNIDFRSSNFYICFDYGHDIKYLLPHLNLFVSRLKSNNLHTKIDDQTKAECESLYKCLVSDVKFVELFTVSGKSYYDFLRIGVESYIKKGLAKAIAEYKSHFELYRELSIKFVLTGTINLGIIKRCQMLAAQSVGAKLITYTEGAGYGSIVTPIYDNTETMDGDIIFCYGPGNIEYYQDLGFIRREFISVGSIRQELIYRNLKNRKFINNYKRVMYCGTAVSDNVMHCPNNGLISTYYLSQQIKIYDFLTHHLHDKEILIRPNPNDHNSRHILCLDKYKGLKIVGGKLEDAISNVDIFIIDFPSTVLLSCLSTNAFIFLLVEDGVSEITPKQFHKLNKRVYIYSEMKELLHALDKFFNDPHSFPEKLDTTYRDSYSFNEALGSSVDRAKNALFKLSSLQI